jgi:mono/diheme cytochrome c family protein
MTRIHSLKNICKTGLLVILLGNLYGCNWNRNDPGWDYFPDMFYSTAYETYSKNPNFKDGSTMRTPAPGTIPAGFTPFEYTIDPGSRIKAGKELVNPFAQGEEILTKGKNSYSVFCIGCHGNRGEGNGNLFTSGLYPMKPRDLSGKDGAKLKDGEIFHTITLGFGSMGAHGTQITPDDRWAIVLYLRKLQEEARETSVINATNK